MPINLGVKIANRSYSFDHWSWTYCFESGNEGAYSFISFLTPALHLNKDQPAVFWKECGFNKNNGPLSTNLFEDNAGAYELVKDPKLWPRTKHIALKYHHFQELISSGTIRINLVGTEDQIADIFTKALEKWCFTHSCKLLCGWWKTYSHKGVLERILFSWKNKH